jgi:hypothetical protein
MAASLTASGLVMSASQSASGDANTLDDYEEGTFTFYSENGGVSSYANQTAYYIKIGKLVFISFYSEQWTCNSSVSATITGLPFNVTNASAAYSTMSTVHDTWNTNSSGGYTALNSNRIHFLQRDQTTASATPSSGVNYFMVAGSYHVA